MTKQFLLPLSQDMAGNTLAVKGYAFGEGSPKVYIQGGTHGGEVTFWVISRLYKWLQENPVKGTVTLVPIANPFAWNQRIYYSTVGKINLQTGEDWNRGFTKESTSLARRRAKRIMEYVEGYDFSIDLHTSRKSIPFSIFPKETNDIKIIKALGMQYNYLLSNRADDSMMSMFSRAKTTFGFEIECGSFDDNDPERVKRLAQNILQFLNYIKVVTYTSQEMPVQQYTFDAFKKYFADSSGILETIKQPEEQYKKNDVLYSLAQSTDYFNPTKIRAEEDGVVMKLLPSNIIWEGDEVIQIISNTSLQKVK